jgi:DMSO reductase anchor subunit
MHPAYSVIFFTVASGMGFGLLALLGLAPLFGIEPVGALGWMGFVLALGACVAGLLSSTQHLGHPERAWRAFSQWRSSWLSREGVLAVATLATGGLYALLALFFGSVITWLGIVVAVLAIATIHATAMIYAQLKTVQRWNNGWTVAGYHAFALASGFLILSVILALLSSEPTSLSSFAVIALVVGGLIKFNWWRHGDNTPALSTPESATGLGHIGEVRMFEPPHTGSNYLLKEMGFKIGRKHRTKLRRLIILLGFGGPLVLCLVSMSGILQAPLLVLALVAHLTGMLMERWLFFAEAEHSVMTYYTR